jgi:hypothetical protein
VTVDGEVPMGVVVVVFMGVGTWHAIMLYYNIMGVHKTQACGPSLESGRRKGTPGARSAERVGAWITGINRCC